MKIKYILGAMGMAFGMTGCNLDITMYDGVMEEQFDNKNLLELSQGSYRLLKNDGGLIDNGYYFWAFGADDVTWNGTSTGSTLNCMIIAETLPVPLQNILGSSAIV